MAFSFYVLITVLLFIDMLMIVLLYYKHLDAHTIILLNLGKTRIVLCNIPLVPGALNNVRHTSTYNYFLYALYYYLNIITKDIDGPYIQLICLVFELSHVVINVK